MTPLIERLLDISTQIPLGNLIILVIVVAFVVKGGTVVLRFKK